jgi:hypothetical protein
MEFPMKQIITLFIHDHIILHASTHHKYAISIDIYVKIKYFSDDYNFDLLTEKLLEQNDRL